MENESKPSSSRRQFIATGAAAATAFSAFPFVRTGAAQEAPLKVGIVGTGGRGTGACANALVADDAVELVGMADIAPDRITWSLDRLRNHRDLQDEAIQKRIKVTEETSFSGTGAYKELMAMDLDYVILTAPPGFRPLHFAEAVERDLHVFAEKPLATDPTGCRAIRGTAEEAKRKGLSVVVGLNYRHDLGTMELVKRVHDGAVGEIVAGRMHRMGGSLWHRGSYPQWAPLEYQCRNWYYYCWLGGDQIVEQVIHQIDLMNWVMGATPVSALGQGGRLIRTGSRWGNIFDHMSVTYEYPGGVEVQVLLRQWPNCENRNDNKVVGTLGSTDNRRNIMGAHPWAYEPSEDKRSEATVYEHMELIKSIRDGAPRSDALDFGIDGTLTTIMGRESAYTGQVITWDEISASGLDLFPKNYPNGAPPDRPVPVPGTPRAV